MKRVCSDNKGWGVKMSTDKMPNDLLAFCPDKIPIEIETDKMPNNKKKSLDKMLTNHLAFCSLAFCLLAFYPTTRKYQCNCCSFNFF